MCIDLQRKPRSTVSFISNKNVSYVNVCAGVSRGQKRTQDPALLELQAIVNHLTWMLGTWFGPLKEQQMLLTFEPSFQHWFYNFYGLTTHVSV